jgi:hypothetical protein
MRAAMLHRRHRARAHRALFLATRERATVTLLPRSCESIAGAPNERRSMTLDLRKPPYAGHAQGGGMRIGLCAIAGVACPFVVSSPSRALRAGVAANP